MPIIESFVNLGRRLRRALGRSTFETQLNDELRFHVDAESAELVRHGVEPGEARRQALAALGGMDRWRDEARETRATTSLETMMRDLRLSLRSLRRSPSYTIPVVATLALGIGAMASIATLAYDVIFRPLPYRNPGDLVAVFERNVPRKRDRNVVSAVAVEGWRQRSRTLDSISVLMPASRVWQSDAGPERVSGAEVGPNLFALLGRQPVLGAGFSSATAVNEVIVSYNFWSTRLSADSTMVGKSIRLDGQPVTLVGVMPSDFVPLRFGWMGAQEYWLPLVLTQQHNDWGRFLLVAARLKPGMTVAAASRELESIHAQLRSEGAIADGWYSQVIPLTEEITGNVRPALLALLVACGLLLAMVLTNTTLLTIAHAERRAGDRALRAVLGATGRRLLAERLMTSVLLAGAGAASGIALSLWAIPALATFLPEGVPRLANVHFGAMAVIIGTGTGLLASLLLAVVPFLGQRGDTTSAALHGGARLTKGTRTTWVVVGEAATAVVLSLFAALTLRSFDRLSSVDYGFNPQRMIAFRVGFASPGVSEATAVATSKAFFERVRAIPGVLTAGRTSVRPFGQGGTATTITPLGWGEKDRSAFPTGDVRFVDAEYFKVLGLTPISGRVFSGSEKAGGPMRVVVNEMFGKKLWPGESGLVGRSFDLRVNNNPSPEIIGVVRDVRLTSPRDDARPTVYVFTEQMSAGEEYDVLVRTSVDESAVLPQIREAVHGVSAATPIFRVESMQHTVDQTIARERVTAQLLLFFAMAALLLVAVGVYGLFAGEVSRRRREIGVRMALGETATGVVRSMLARALLRTTAGVVAGGLIAFLASRLLQAVLFGIAPTDPVSYIAAAVVVIATALGATLVPALQASAVAPSEALRAE